MKINSLYEKMSAEQLYFVFIGTGHAKTTGIHGQQEQPDKNQLLSRCEDNPRSCQNSVFVSIDFINVEINLYKDGILHASIYKTMN